MITKITGITPIRCHSNSLRNENTATFTGLTHRMGNKVYNGLYEMNILFPKDKMLSSISGSLPNYMVKRIGTVTNNTEAATKEILKTFGKIANELRDFSQETAQTMAEFRYRRKNSTVETLKDVLKKYNILRSYDDFDIHYIDKGGKGAVYKLEGLKDIREFDEDEYVIKVFHNKSIQANAYHGCFPEINAATYWMRTFGPETNRGKFFWSDVKEAYMINKYIDEDVRLPKYFPNPYDYGMKFTDEDAIHIHNICKHYSYDWGGGVVINQVINSNKFARAIKNKIQNTPEYCRTQEWYRQYAIKSKGNHDSKMAGLTIALRYLNPKERLQGFENSFIRRGKYNDRALGYTLKYLPHDIAIENYERLAKTTNDNVLRRILKNEIPLLSTKEEFKTDIKDDLIVLDDINTLRCKNFIDSKRLDEYLGLAKKYHLL